MDEYVETTGAVLGGRAGWDSIVVGLDAAGGKNLEIFSPAVGAEDPTAAVNVRYRPTA